MLRRKLSNTEFRFMQGLMALTDMFYHYVPARAKCFGIEPGMSVVDYGCGPGRYTVEFARLAGERGKVIAVDLVELALEATEKRLRENGISNVELKLAHGYDSGLPQGTADMICAVDMFHHVDPIPFLKELRRISKPDGLLVISGGHQTRRSIKESVASSGLWELSRETKRCMTFKIKP